LVAERLQKFRVQLLGSTNIRKQNVEAKHTSCNIKTFYLKKHRRSERMKKKNKNKSDCNFEMKREERERELRTLHWA